MIWILPRTNHILFSAKDFTTALPASKQLRIRCERLIKKSMYGFQGFLEPHEEICMVFRKSRSAEAIHTTVPTDPWWYQPQLIYKEKYCSMQQSTSSQKEFCAGAPLAFLEPLGANSPHLVHIPMPPTKSNAEAPQTLLSPLEEQGIQKRYYLKRANSAGNTPKDSLDELSTVLKVFSKRNWQNVSSAKEKSSNKPSFDFTLMSYNVLAQKLLRDHPHLYKHHNRKALDWEARWKNLFNEIKTMKPDILCLQEVQDTHLTGYYKQLETLGYQGVYKKRTGIRCDGCALYFKADRLKLIEYETVEFYQPNVPVLNKDNIAIIAKLCPNHSPKHQFIVATTHLLYNPKRQDVRLAQTQLLLTEIERMSFYWNSKGNQKYWPIIITGDFNSTPDSAVYELIVKGELKYDHLTERRMNKPGPPSHGNILVPSHLQITDMCQHACLARNRRKNEDMSRVEEAAHIKLHNGDKTIRKICDQFVENPLLFCSGTLSHLFPLKSVYQHGEPGDPEGSTYQDKWITVDYIFYSGKKKGDKVEDHKLKLLSNYRLPLRSELGSIKIPNSLIGSDHLSLVAKFKMRL